MTRSAVGAAIGAALLVWTGAAAARTPDAQDFAQIERGRYLARVGDCASCHTVSGSGKAFAGGRPIQTPFGNIVSANITPDQETGIGTWTDAQFIRAMTEGRSAHGTRLYPAMPYNNYTKVTTADLLALRAYLDTLEPVHNEVHSDILPFPFNIRLSMAFWNWLFFTPGTFQPVAGKSEEWNRGAYLVEGFGHCSDCHTPKNLLGGDKSGQYLRGYTLQGWFAPDITGDPRTGLGNWSVEDIVSYLKTGVNAHTTASGPMAEEIELASSHMSDADLRAIAAYLKDQKPAATQEPQPIAASDPRMKEGLAIYTDQCAACHTTGGTGITRLFPTLKGTPFVQSVEPTSLVHVVLEGTRAVATDPAPTSAAMPPFGWKLNDEQVGAVLTYIRNAWGNRASAVSAADVKSARGQLGGSG